MSQSKRRVAIITGGSRGIGKGIAMKLAQNNIDVFLIATKEVHLKEVKSKIEKMEEPHGRCEFYVVDVRNREEMKVAAKQCISVFGSIDILVNNAGIMPISWVKSLKEDEWERMVDINCKGVLNGVGACLPYMMEKKKGHIICMSSDAGKRAFPGLSVYCGTKYFVEGFVQCLRQEMKEFNIKVTTIQPGDVGTDIGMDTTDTGAYDEICKEKHKILKVNDIANAVYYAINQPDYCAVNEILIEPTELPI